LSASGIAYTVPSLSVACSAGTSQQTQAYHFGCGSVPSKRIRTVNGRQPAYRSLSASRSQPTLGTRRRPSRICTLSGIGKARNGAVPGLEAGLALVHGARQNRR